ncbi:helix-turn-helix domain-containing protein [Acinetobacter sp. CUI P1]|nr:helix-turn-helix domain-containing protein [Acinetobacter sp. CUI P1]
MATKPINEYPPILDVIDIQMMMGIGRRQAYELVNSGQFHTVRVGKSIKISKEIFLDWLNGSRNTNAG